MLQIIIENVRSFVSNQSIPIAPLTLLTGENSSGKTTLLAVLAAVLDPDGFPFRLGFNRPPYSLGAYDTIASYKGGKFGRAKSFLVGYEDDQARRGVATAVHACYHEHDGQPTISRVDVRGREGGTISLAIHRTDPNLQGQLTVRTENFEHQRPFQFRFPLRDIHAFGFSGLLLRALLGQERPVDHKLIEQVNTIARVFTPGRAVSLAPIRTRPERVYSEPTDVFEPSGNHVPFVLDRLLREEESKETDAVVDALKQFGQESGLIRAVQVRRLGRKAGHPFQVMVGVGGPMRNLIDVGYGVSQALPIIVQTALASSRETVLIQQPEVHLHPRAQAALGTLFAAVVQSGRKRLVVETHSDFLIDRVRQEVATGRLNAESVRVLFLERSQMETKVFPLAVDRNGNLETAPPSYRAFFLQEQLRLFSRGE